MAESSSSPTTPHARIEDSVGGSGNGRIMERWDKVKYLMLTRTNYADYALLIRVNMQAQGLWEEIEPGVADYHDDKMALFVILRAVLPEMLRTLAGKDTAKEAWDTVKTMRMGSNACVRPRRRNSAPTLRRSSSRMASPSRTSRCGLRDSSTTCNYSATSCLKRR
ncbi:uncharacterized protein M6B38_390630 [Iris pallida]|uniref:Gag protein n=1 Tax=Iris pallida TaxID=29817 RepID=A0AAX6FZ34_IRIPA|nr:uncharacterized protein M6B38_390630 [Iris pallida]